MQPESPKHLEDIRDAATFVIEVARKRTLEQYIEDRLARQAVERNFEIIGEALNRLGRTDLRGAGVDVPRQQRQGPAALANLKPQPGGGPPR